MDLYCGRCGEPWDIYYVQQEMTPDERHRFRCGKGCPVCYGKTIERRPLRAELSAALGELLGDDLDGLAAEMEDAESMLGKEFWQ